MVVANHESNLDGFVLISVFAERRLTFLSAAHLFEKPAIGTVSARNRRAPGRGAARQPHELQEALAILATGGTVAVFPQGGIDRDEIRGGAAYLALKANAALLPLHLAGRRRLFRPTVGGPPWLASRCVSVCP